MTNNLRWGILGTGNIARKFAPQVPGSARGALVAVGSREQQRAEQFANEFGGAATTYEGLLADENVDAVYNSLPNSLHAEWSIRAMQAGKHVLCEKPIASHAAEAREMFAAAEQTGRVLVEAFMYRSHPAVQRFVAMAREGAIGSLKLVRSNFTFQRTATVEDVRYQPQLAGGSIMDVGCYCVNLTRAIAGREPTGVRAFAHMYESGVDEYAAGALSFDNEVLATFTCGMTVRSDMTTFVAGSDGWMKIEKPWFSSGSFTIVRDETEEVVTIGQDNTNYYALEADAFAATVLDAAPPAITAADSIGNMTVLDELRKSAGLAY